MKHFRYKRNFHILILLIFSLILISCKFEFNQDDLIPYNTYRENELLMFKSSENNIDTFKITSKEIYYTNWTPIERDGKYNPPNAVVKYEKLNSKDYKIFNQNRKEYENPELFHIRKHSPDSPTMVGVKFQNFYREFELSNNTLPKKNIDLNNSKVECFVLTDPNLHNKEDVETIYLDANYNMIRYDTGTGIIWIRIN